MATSITASNSSSPFNGFLLTDANFTVSQSWSTTSAGGTTPSFNFKVAAPWPTISQTELYIYSTAPTGTSTSASALTLQDSADGTTWANVAPFAAPLLTVYGNTAISTTVTLQPTARQYLRLSGSNLSASSAPVGTFGMTLLF